MFELPQIAQVVRALLATCFGITCLTTLPELRREHRPRHGDSAVTSGAHSSLELAAVRDRRNQVVATLLKRHILLSEFAAGVRVKPLLKSDVLAIPLPTSQYL
jgi:hypothetical protein